MLLLAFALLLAGGMVLVVAARRGGRDHPSCGNCGYDVSGSIGAVTRCPECGREFAEAGIIPARRQWNPLMLSLGIIVIVVVLGCLGTGFVYQRLAVAQAKAQQRAAAAQAAQAQTAQTQQSTPSSTVESSEPAPTDAETGRE